MSNSEAGIIPGSTSPEKQTEFKPPNLLAGGLNTGRRSSPSNLVVRRLPWLSACNTQHQKWRLECLSPSHALLEHERPFPWDMHQPWYDDWATREHRDAAGR